jgi:hypothetical protein
MNNLYFKLILTVTAITGLLTGTKAQVFPESFEGTFPPTGWVTFDNGIGTTESWQISTTAQAGLQAAHIQYENVTAGIAEDWLVTPSVAITPTSSILSFWERENFTSNWGSVYNVLVSTSSQTNTASFTVVATYTENLVNPLVYKNRVVNLSAYVGQNVYIAFRHDNDDGDDWLLDNINLGGGCVTSPTVGVISGTTNTTYNSTNQYTVSGYTGTLQWYSGPSGSGPWTAIAGATTTPQNITATMGGTMYLIAVASSSVGGCLDDTTNIAHAVSVFFPGDDACGSVSLTVGPSSTYYHLTGASVQPGEVFPAAGSCTAQTTWCNNTLDNTRWFQFTAPASGHVIIHAPDFDTQLALWSATNCSGVLSTSTATLVVANDDDPDYIMNGGVQFSSYLHAGCLTPGTVYWLQLDSYSPAISSDSTRLIITDGVTPLNASFTGLNTNYCLPASGSALTPATNGGIFTVNSNTTGITNFSPSAAGVGTHTVYYSVSGCRSSSVTTIGNTPSIVAASSASMLCAGQSATLSATGASTFSWMPTGTGPTIVVTPSVTSTYTVIGTTSACSGTTTITQNVSACTGINEVTALVGTKVWPNPNNGSFTVHSDVIATEIVITDVLGKRIYAVRPTNTSTVIDIRLFDQGIYFVTVKTDKGNTITKVIKE